MAYSQRDAAVRARAAALLGDGVPADKVAAKLGVSRRSVFRWANAAEATRGGPKPAEVPPGTSEAAQANAAAGVAAGVEDHDVEAVLARVVHLAQLQLLDPQCSSIDRQRARNDIMALEERRRKRELEGAARSDRFDFGRLTRDELDLLLPLIEKAKVA